jgi:hypothetical protein
LVSSLFNFLERSRSMKDSVQILTWMKIYEPPEPPKTKKKQLFSPWKNEYAKMRLRNL